MGLAGKWIDEMLDSIGKFFVAETTDGINREGKITGFTYRSFKLNGKMVELPIEIEINGDPNDRLPLDRINHMSIK